MNPSSGFPEPPNSGEKLSASWGRKVVAALRSLVPIAGPGIRVSYTFRGAIIEAVAKPVRNGLSQDKENPLEVVLATKEGAAAAVTVVDGTVSGQVPTIDGQPITATPKPALSITGSGYVLLRTTWDSDFIPRSQPLTAEFIFQSGNPDAYFPPPSDSRTEAKMLHARIWAKTDGGNVSITKILTVPGGNITVFRNSYSDSVHEFVALRS